MRFFKRPYQVRILSLLFLLGFLLCNYNGTSQCKLVISYDQAGNRIFKGLESDNPADLTTSVTVLPTIATGITTNYWQIKIQEVAGECSSGEIMVVMPKDPRLTFTYDPTLTTVAIFSVDNSNWTYDNSNQFFHIWRSNDSIEASSSSKFGMVAQYDPQATSGSVSYAITIVSGSGGEVNSSNNIDVETILYHSN